MAGLYLTIDDSPSANFPHLCAFLKEHNIPAIFFCRGDNVSLYKDEVIRAIKDGFVIANHSWSHARASRLGADLAIKEVLKTQDIIDTLYAQAGIKPPQMKIMRFPYMDSGLGGWLLPPQEFTNNERVGVERDYLDFYGNSREAPTANQISIHNDIERTLRNQGFVQAQFEGITLDWYNRYTQSSAVSTQGTFSHPDYKLYARYNQDGSHTVQKCNDHFDEYINKHGGNHIIVMHDKEELWPYTQELIMHMLKSKHHFLPIPN